MAPNGHAPTDLPAVDKQSQAYSRPKSYERKRSAEFKIWQKENPTQTLTYDDWKSSKHVDGISLYYATLHIWDDLTTSDEESEEAKVEARPRAVRAQSAREPKKSLKTNGNGVLRPAASATPTANAKPENLSPSARKKRKTQKKYLSEELVASEGSDHGETSTPNASINTVNGRRKSSNRKPRKKPISEEIVSPEDEEEDPTAALNGIATAAIASPLPVRSAPRPAATVQTSDTPKKTFLKLSTRRAPKKVLSEETILDDDTDEGAGTTATGPSTVAAITEPNITATTESHTPLAASSVIASNDATASPDPTSDSAAATRRGLRARRPAQQRPYSYDAQTFEESETDVPEEDAGAQPSPHLAQSRQVSTISYGRGISEDQLEELDEESLAILQGDLDPEPERDTGRPKHFKGKGRAWKKEASDEDLDFTVGKKKKKAAAVAAARAKAKDSNLLPRKRGRPKKTIMSEDVVRDDSDSDAPEKSAEPSPSPAASEAPAKKARKPPRKSALSEEIVRDESDEDENSGANLGAQESAMPETKRSDHAATAQVTEAEPIVSYTPKGTPKKSYTPKGEPKHVRLSVANTESEVINVGDDSEVNDAPQSPTSPGDDIEKHMASVNADDDDEMEL